MISSRSLSDSQYHNKKGDSILKNINPTETKAWKRLEKLYTTQKIDLREAFATDPKRFQTFSRMMEGEILLDFSKNLIDEEIFEKERDEKQ